MSDKRIEISEKHFNVPQANHEGICYIHTDWDNILNAMDEYGKEMAIEFLRYVLKNMHGYSVDAAENIEIKWKGEWLTPEQLFENFL